MSESILREIRTVQMRQILYGLFGRDVICSSSKGEFTRNEEIFVMYRKSNRYFIARNGKPIATAETRIDCAKKAFLNGYLDGEQYHFFSAGHKAMRDYARNQRNKERLMR